MKSEKLYQRITKLIQKQGFKELKLDPVIETKYIRDENLKKYLFRIVNGNLVFYDENN